MYLFQEKNNLFYKYNTISILTYLGVIFFLALVFSHPIFLLALLASQAMVVYSAGIFDKWKVYFKISLSMILVLTVVNSLIVKSGITIIFRKTGIPLIGELRISLESIIYALTMGVKLIVILSVFCFFTYAVSPDKTLKLISKWGKKTSLTLILAVRLFPLMIGDYRRIVEAQQYRGVDFDEKGIRKKVKKYIPVINNMLIASLERSFQLAESMSARGFGVTKRSFLNKEYWKPRDTILIINSIMVLVLALVSVLENSLVYIYYPKYTKITLESVNYSLGFLLLAILPVILNWGWNKWRYLRLKI